MRDSINELFNAPHSSPLGCTGALGAISRSRTAQMLTFHSTHVAVHKHGGEWPAWNGEQDYADYIFDTFFTVQSHETGDLVEMDFDGTWYMGEVTSCDNTARTFAAKFADGDAVGNVAFDDEDTRWPPASSKSGLTQRPWSNVFSNLVDDNQAKIKHAIDNINCAGLHNRVGCAWQGADNLPLDASYRAAATPVGTGTVDEIPAINHRELLRDAAANGVHNLYEIVAGVVGTDWENVLSPPQLALLNDYENKRATMTPLSETVRLSAAELLIEMSSADAGGQASPPAAVKQETKSTPQESLHLFDKVLNKGKQLMAQYVAVMYKNFVCTPHTCIEQIYSDNMPMSVGDFCCLKDIMSDVNGKVTTCYAVAVLQQLRRALPVLDPGADDMRDTMSTNTLPLGDYLTERVLENHSFPFRSLLAQAQDHHRAHEEGTDIVGYPVGQWDLDRGKKADAYSVFSLLDSWKAFALLYSALPAKMCSLSLFPAVGRPGNTHPTASQCLAFSSNSSLHGFLSPKWMCDVKMPLDSDFVNLDALLPATPNTPWATATSACLAHNQMKMLRQTRAEAWGEASKSFPPGASRQQVNDTLGPPPPNWFNMRVEVMAAANFAKFEQNHSLYMRLMRTIAAGKWPIYMCSHEQFWGYNGTIKYMFNQDSWPGANLMGSVLAYVRTSLASRCTEQLPIIQAGLNKLRSSRWTKWELQPAVHPRGPALPQLCDCTLLDMNCVAARRRANLAGPMTAASWDKDAIACEMARIQGRGCCDAPWSPQQIAAIMTMNAAKVDKWQCLCRQEGNGCIQRMREQANLQQDDTKRSIEDIILTLAEIPLRPLCAAPLTKLQQCALDAFGMREAQHQIQQYKIEKLRVDTLALATKRSGETFDYKGPDGYMFGPDLEELPPVPRVYLPLVQLRKDVLAAARDPSVLHSILTTARSPAPADIGHAPGSIAEAVADAARARERGVAVPAAGDQSPAYQHRESMRRNALQHAQASVSPTLPHTEQIAGPGFDECFDLSDGVSALAGFAPARAATAAPASFANCQCDPGTQCNCVVHTECHCGAAHEDHCTCNQPPSPIFGEQDQSDWGYSMADDAQIAYEMQKDELQPQAAWAPNESLPTRYSNGADEVFHMAQEDAMVRDSYAAAAAQHSGGEAAHGDGTHGLGHGYNTAGLNALLPPGASVPSETLARMHKYMQDSATASTVTQPLPAPPVGASANIDVLYIAADGFYRYCVLCPETLETKDTPLFNIMFPACGKPKTVHSSRLVPYCKFRLNTAHLRDVETLLGPSIPPGIIGINALSAIKAENKITVPKQEASESTVVNLQQQVDSMKALRSRAKALGASDQQMETWASSASQRRDATEWCDRKQLDNDKARWLAPSNALFAGEQGKWQAASTHEDMRVLNGESLWKHEVALTFPVTDSGMSIQMFAATGGFRDRIYRVARNSVRKYDAELVGQPHGNNSPPKTWARRGHDKRRSASALQVKTAGVDHKFTKEPFELMAICGLGAAAKWTLCTTNVTAERNAKAIREHDGALPLNYMVVRFRNNRVAVMPPDMVADYSAKLAGQKWIPGTSLSPSHTTSNIGGSVAQTKIAQQAQS